MPSSKPIRFLPKNQIEIYFQAKRYSNKRYGDNLLSAVAIIPAEALKNVK